MSRTLDIENCTVFLYRIALEDDFYIYPLSARIRIIRSTVQSPTFSEDLHICSVSRPFRVLNSVTSIILRLRWHAKCTLQEGTNILGQQACPLRADRLSLLSGRLPVSSYYCAFFMATQFTSFSTWGGSKKGAIPADKHRWASLKTRYTHDYLAHMEDHSNFTSGQCSFKVKVLLLHKACAYYTT